MANYPRRPCVSCGLVTRSAEPRCAVCQDALVDGEWVTRGAIKVWVPAPPPPIRTVDRNATPWVTLGRCPTCRVGAMEPCRIPSGGISRRPHAARVTSGAPRICQTVGCGAPLTGHYKQRYCPPCAVERKRQGDAAAFKRHQQRQREEEAA